MDALFDSLGGSDTVTLTVESVDYPNYIAPASDSFVLSYENPCHTAVLDIIAPNDLTVSVFTPTPSVDYTLSVTDQGGLVETRCGTFTVVSTMIGTSGDIFTFTESDIGPNFVFTDLTDGSLDSLFDLAST